jgi:hypothetical protein
VGIMDGILPDKFTRIENVVGKLRKGPRSFSRPLEIDNSDLIAKAESQYDPTNYRLKSMLLLNTHFVLVNHEVWCKLKELYGAKPYMENRPKNDKRAMIADGPELSRVVVSAGAFYHIETYEVMVELRQVESSGVSLSSEKHYRQMSRATRLTSVFLLIQELFKCSNPNDLRISFTHHESLVNAVMINLENKDQRGWTIEEVMTPPSSDVADDKDCRRCMIIIEIKVKGQFPVDIARQKTKEKQEEEERALPVVVPFSSSSNGYSNGVDYGGGFKPKVHQDSSSSSSAVPSWGKRFPSGKK